jgi:hypothetical protein
MLKNKAYCIIVFIVLLVLAGSSAEGQKYKDHKWFKAYGHTNIPDSLKGSDAVMIYNNQYIYNDIVNLETGKFSSKRTVMQKIKILTQKGLEEYSKVFLNIYPNEQIKVIDARTIKTNRKTVNLKSKDIKKLNFKSRFYQDSRFQQLRFSIPGVEIGDEVEIIYTVKSGKLTQGADITMHSYLPCLSASITYGSSKAFVHEIKMYNGMPRFEDQSSQTNTTLVWRMSNLKSIGNQNRAIYTNEIPFIRYVIRQYSGGYNVIDLSKNDWGSIYKKYEHYYNDPSVIIGKQAYLRGFIQKFRYQKHGADNVQVFKAIHQYIYDNIEVKILENGEDKRLLKYYLENKVINNYNLFLLYDKLFKLLEIKRYICFGRNKYDGVLDRNFVAPHIIQHDFYSFYEGDRLHFVYPSFSNKRYLLDEIPNSLQGTSIMMITNGKKGSIFNESLEIKIPMSSPEKNYKLKNLNIKIMNPIDSNFDATSTVTFSGVYSTMYREKHTEKIDKKDYDFYSSFIFEDEIEIDNVDMVINKKVSPFQYTLKSEHSFPLQIDKLDDNLYNLKISQLLSISNLYSSDETRFLKYYTSYKYNDISLIQIEFDNNIKVENLENLNRLNIENQYGSVIFNVAQKDKQTIVVNVSYKIKNELLKANEYSNLRELNKSLKEGLLQAITFSVETE